VDMRVKSRKVYAAVGAAAVAMAVALVAASLLGARGTSHATKVTGPTLPGAAETAALFRGIPQHGTTLGSPRAPVTLVEFADPQCPYCAQFTAQTLPVIVRDYVRTGKVRLVFRGLAFLGPDSGTALRWVLAAGQQNRLWNELDILYRNQGTENTGWVTQDLLDAAARSVKGLDLARMHSDQGSSAVRAEAAAAAAAAGRAHVPGTPYFEAGRSLASVRPLALKSFDPKAAAAQLDTLLKR